MQRVDRRAIFRVLKWGARRNQDIPGYHRGIIKSVITGAGTFQHQLHAAGLADSDRCPFCTLDEPEDAPHVFWRSNPPTTMLVDVPCVVSQHT